VGKLPETIRNPVLSELTPLKELFLLQRPPRFLFVGSSKMPMAKIVRALFSPAAGEQMSVAVTPVHCWTEWNIPNSGTISILDARDAEDVAQAAIEKELSQQLADIIFFLDDGQMRLPRLPTPNEAKIVGIAVGNEERTEKLRESLSAEPAIRNRLLKVIRFNEKQSDEARELMSILSQQLPNEAKIEMIRVSHDSEAQHHVAQMLVKSTTAICTAIGAQPIPLADLPILTTLQLMMVSGIMYISGRERSLRAATEFVGALGANVGAGMLLREGTRAILKFFPGWGNVVCGMVAGAGTYAIGRAATVYFLEGVSLKDARRTYLTSRRRRARPSLIGGKS
jgi:uncharacterized protein (DUF697 family)